MVYSDVCPALIFIQRKILRSPYDDVRSCILPFMRSCILPFFTARLADARVYISTSTTCVPITSVCFISISFVYSVLSICSQRTPPTARTPLHILRFDHLAQLTLSPPLCVQLRRRIPPPPCLYTLIIGVTTPTMEWNPLLSRVAKDFPPFDAQRHFHVILTNNHLHMCSSLRDRQALNSSSPTRRPHFPWLCLPFPVSDVGNGRPKRTQQ